MNICIYSQLYLYDITRFVASFIQLFKKITKFYFRLAFASDAIFSILEVVKECFAGVLIFCTLMFLGPWIRIRKRFATSNFDQKHVLCKNMKILVLSWILDRNSKSMWFLFRDCARHNYLHFIIEKVPLRLTIAVLERTGKWLQNPNCAKTTVSTVKVQFKRKIYFTLILAVKVCS